MDLAEADSAALDGARGEAAELAMRIVVSAAGMLNATELVDVSMAHIDGCLYHGRAGLDFARRLRDTGGRVAVPTTLNVGSLDLLHPNLYRGDAATAALGRELMDCYVAMGCEPTWTCAPYQDRQQRPRFGEHIAWAESNAVVFANSVLGARTARYGDFLDICAALTGRVPLAGLHVTAFRRGEVVFDVAHLGPEAFEADIFYAALGHLVGAMCGSAVPVVDGLPSGTSEDRLKAFGAAAASAGAVGMFHAVGVTPEAATLDDALHGQAAVRTVDVTAEQVRGAVDALSTTATTTLAAVSVGTPHFSAAEFAELIPLFEGRRVHSGVDFWVSTSRAVLAEVAAKGSLPALEHAGVQLVVDTCTYVTPLLAPKQGVVMTNSGKWAYYAPGNLGVDVVFATLADCVESAVAGRVVRNGWPWRA